MKNRRFQFQSQLVWLSALIIPIIATSASAQKANFSALTLSPGFDPGKAIVSGYTGGSYSLSAITNRDRNKKTCVGFADTDPNHILILEKDFPSLKILVDTGGYDTTLLIQGLDNGTVRCGDDTGKNKDASISDSEWKKGRYGIWVGTFDPEVKQNYTLKVQQ